MKVLLSSVLFLSVLLPSLGNDIVRNIVPLSDQNEGAGTIVSPTIGGGNIEPREVVAPTLLKKNTLNVTKQSIEEEERALAHRHTPHYYPYPEPRYHRNKSYNTNDKYHGTSTKGYESKGLYGKGGGGGGKGGNDAKGKGKGKGFSFSSPPRSKYSFSRIGKGKGEGGSLSSDSNEQSKGKGKGKGKGIYYSSPPRSQYSFSRMSKGKGGAAGSMSSEDDDDSNHEHNNHDNMMLASSSCLDNVFEIVQKWGGDNGIIMEPDGTLVDSVHDASVHSGQRWPFVRPVVSSDNHYRRHSSSHHKKKKNVGSNTELCKRINHGETWHCQGTYQLDLHHGCQGQLSFSGPFNDNDSLGKYTIVGGTGAFHGATGYIIDDFDYDTLYSILQIYVQQ